jgi:hypothetical protein
VPRHEPRGDEEPVIRWRNKVAGHDFEAALRYLSLRFSDELADKVVAALRRLPALEHRRANDVLRACDREPLPLDDPGVLRDLVKVARGEALSPVLLVRFEDRAEIADGYHRVSLGYRLDPFGEVPLLITGV